MWLVGIVICAGWIFSLCLHEFSHAILAYWAGDTSVKQKGYLTFNPLKYTDTGYSIALPLLFLLIGGIGLPGGVVYINQHKLKSRWWQTAVSAAGPAANIFMALLLTICFWIFAGDSLLPNHPIGEDSFFLSGIAFLIYLQVFAAIFNLLPIPGLDGYGMIEPWLSRQLQSKFNRVSKYSTLIIVGLFLYVPWFSSFTTTVIRFITDQCLQIPINFIGMGSSLFRHPINQFITLIVLLSFGWSLNAQNKNLGQKHVMSPHRVAPPHGGEQNRRGTHLVKEKPTVANQVHPETRKRTLSMAGHDLKRIERLLNSTRLKHPDRSEQWHWEKILYDMERDRRL